MNTPWLDPISAGLAILALEGLVKAVRWDMSLFGIEWPREPGI